VGIGVAENEKNAGLRAALIMAARERMGRGDAPDIDVAQLCADVGIARTEFHRFFADHDELIAAVLEEDVAQLQGIAEAAAVERVPRAVVNGPAIGAPAPPPDAWLERRLRVFERALSALESRQEKTEQLLNRSVALLEEKRAPVLERAAPAEQQAAPVAKALEPEGRPVPVKAKPLPLPDLDPLPAVTPEEMEGLLENARRAAREAAVEEEAPEKPRRTPGWMTWVGLGAILAMAGTALVLAHVMGVRAGSVQHRQAVQPPLARVTALADSGDPRSQTKLALAYLHGENMKSDVPAALRWGLAAARQGDPLAQYLIATCYAEGNGVAADQDQAFKWFEASALRGNLKAMHDLAIAYDQGRGTARDASRAAAWFNRAAHQGYVDSQFDLAVLYERGDGVKQNPVSALKWYLIAAKSGDAQAGSRADQLAREMPAGEAARARMQAENFKPATRDPIANAL
jgi:TPR repeat protein